MENYLVLWTSYLESENAMLQRRSNIIADVDKATKALAKAKPNKVSRLGGRMEVAFMLLNSPARVLITAPEIFSERFFPRETIDFGTIFSDALLRAVQKQALYS